MRIVFDTDVVVAGLRAVLRREVEILLSVPLMLQYEDVLLRSEILTSIGGMMKAVGQFLDVLCAVGRPVEISFLWRPTLRDPDDEMVLEAAMTVGPAGS